MQAHPERFDENVKRSLDDPRLKIAIRRTTDKAEQQRQAAVDAFPGFEQARLQGEQIKDHVIRHLDFYLQEFEENLVLETHLSYPDHKFGYY